MLLIDVTFAMSLDIYFPFGRERGGIHRGYLCSALIRVDGIYSDSGVITHLHSTVIDGHVTMLTWGNIYFQLKLFYMRETT